MGGGGREPELARPFAVPGYPLALCLLSLGSLIYYNLWLSDIFLAGLVGLLGLYVLLKRGGGLSAEPSANPRLSG